MRIPYVITLIVLVARGIMGLQLRSLTRTPPAATWRRRMAVRQSVGNRYVPDGLSEDEWNKLQRSEAAREAEKDYGAWGPRFNRMGAPEGDWMNMRDLWTLGIPSSRPPLRDNKGGMERVRNVFQRGGRWLVWANGNCVGIAFCLAYCWPHRSSWMLPEGCRLSLLARASTATQLLRDRYPSSPLLLAGAVALAGRAFTYRLPLPPPVASIDAGVRRRRRALSIARGLLVRAVAAGAVLALAWLENRSLGSRVLLDGAVIFSGGALKSK